MQFQQDEGDMERRWGIPFQRAYEQGKMNFFWPIMAANIKDNPKTRIGPVFIFADFVQSFYGPIDPPWKQDDEAEIIESSKVYHLALEGTFSSIKSNKNNQDSDGNNGNNDETNRATTRKSSDENENENNERNEKTNSNSSPVTPRARLQHSSTQNFPVANSAPSSRLSTESLIMLPIPRPPSISLSRPPSFSLSANRHDSISSLALPDDEQRSVVSAAELTLVAGNEKANRTEKAALPRGDDTAFSTRGDPQFDINNELGLEPQRSPVSWFPTATSPTEREERQSAKQQGVASIRRSSTFSLPSAEQRRSEASLPLGFHNW